MNYMHTQLRYSSVSKTNNDSELYYSVKSSCAGALIDDTIHRCQINLAQIRSNIGFCEEWETRVPEEKPLGAEYRTNKLPSYDAWLGFFVFYWGKNRFLLVSLINVFIRNQTRLKWLKKHG